MRRDILKVEEDLAPQLLEKTWDEVFQFRLENIRNVSSVYLKKHL